MAILVFTYGILTDAEGTRMRAPSTVDLGADRLDGYTLEACFHLTIAPSPDSSVEGVLWEVDAAALARFDGIEGYPRYYDRIEVTLASGRQAWVYVMQPAASLARGRVSPSISAADRGYAEHGIPTAQLDTACGNALADAYDSAHALRS